MKEFLSLGSNQIITYDPQEKNFRLKSEIVINTVEVGYRLSPDKDDNAQIIKVPEVETFRFFANSSELLKIRDRIIAELEMLEELAKANNGDSDDNCDH